MTFFEVHSSFRVSTSPVLLLILYSGLKGALGCLGGSEVDDLLWGGLLWFEGSLGGSMFMAEGFWGGVGWKPCWPSLACLLDLMSSVILKPVILSQRPLM